MFRSGPAAVRLLAEFSPVKKNPSRSHNWSRQQHFTTSLLPVSRIDATSQLMISQAKRCTNIKRIQRRCVTNDASRITKVSWCIRGFNPSSAKLFFRTQATNKLRVTPETILGPFMFKSIYQPSHENLIKLYASN